MEFSREAAKKIVDDYDKLREKIASVAVDIFFEGRGIFDYSDVQGVNINYYTVDAWLIDDFRREQISIPVEYLNMNKEEYIKDWTIRQAEKEAAEKLRRELELKQIRFEKYLELKKEFEDYV